MRRAACVLALVAAAVAAPPPPEVFFGHRMGTDRKLVAWDRVVAYFEELARTSDRVRTEVLGPSTEGLPVIVATIAAPETLARLEFYRAIQKALADPRRTPPEEAQRLIAQGKAVVMITCAIHSTEVASTQTAIEFAHRMATASDAKTRAVLDNVILLLVPSLNPDGVEIVRRWYERTLGTPYEGTAPPELYHKYTGHDNNRDWYIFSQQETRLVVSKLHNGWHPQIVYDVHQQSPYGARMFVPPWIDPIDPNIDPILVQLTNMIGMGMAADLTASGKTGVVVNASYDFWTPARHYQAYHGGMRLLSEAAGIRIASPITVKPEEIEKQGRGFSPRQASWNYPEPWLGGEWRLRDIVEYQLVTFESCLWQAAVRREDLLRAFYRIGQRAVARRAPAAFVIPAEQPDPGSARKLAETLAFGLVEIEQAEEAFASGERRYPAGTYVVRMQQPYSAFAKTLLERQRYPDLRLYPGGPPKPPYDVTAHTLPLLMGVRVEQLEAPVTVRLKPAGPFEFRLAGPRPPEGAMPASDIDSWREVNRIWAAGSRLWRDAKTGDFYRKLAPGVEAFEVRRPQMGLYRSWVPNMDEGWTRWLLEEFGFAYQRVDNRRIAAGGLESDFDVLIFPDQAENTMARGYAPGAMPEEFTGGLDERCAAALKAFAAAGGTLVFLNRASEYAVRRLELGVRNVVEGLKSEQYYSPGSLLRLRLAAHPLRYGLPEEIAVWSQASPAWEAPEAVTVGRYPESQILASGWLLGEEHLRNRAAIVEVPLGRGRVILFGLRPQYRAQSYQTFKLFFNALVRASAPEGVRFR